MLHGRRIRAFPRVPGLRRPWLAIDPAPLLSLLALVALFALSCASPEPPVSLPPSIGEWSRSSEAHVTPEQIPDSLKRLEAESGSRASYHHGDVIVQAAIYRMPSQTAAFEAVQTYHRLADEYYFQKGASFVVLSLASVPVDGRRNFLLAFQKALSPDGPQKPDGSN